MGVSNFERPGVDPHQPHTFCFSSKWLGISRAIFRIIDRVYYDEKCSESPFPAFIVSAVALPRVFIVLMTTFGI